MDLCTVTNKKYINNVINLLNSYKVNSYNKNIFVYCFDMEQKEIDQLNKNYTDAQFLFVPRVNDYAYHPTVFLYKVYALNDCINRTDSFIYSDATNVFNRFVDLKKYLIDDSLLLPYNSEKLTNAYWTTKKCFEKMDCHTAAIMNQYWAGFQAYCSTEENKLFLKQMYDYMLVPEIALPDTSIKKPDGIDSICIEHRQDQSVLSLLIDKHFRHQKYDHERQLLFGDWQTFSIFNNGYAHDINNCCLSSRESKFGNFRFINNKENTWVI